MMNLQDNKTLAKPLARLMNLPFIRSWNKPDERHKSYYALVCVLFILVGMIQSWGVALSILNLGIISAVMALGLNIQWGYAGLLNVGVMGFVALGGLMAVLVSVAPVPEAWQAGGAMILFSGVLFLATIILAIWCYKKMPAGKKRFWSMVGVIIIGVFTTRYIFVDAKQMVEAINPVRTGYLGGLSLPILFGLPMGALAAAAAAWLIGKISLNLRSDYLAIATLGISEIIINILKNEEWLARGVKNVTGLSRPVPYEVNLRESQWFQAIHDVIGGNILILSSNFVKICYALLFGAVLYGLLILSERALASPWGRMMRAIRDNEVSAAAMGKNVVRRHLQVFVLGAAIMGIAGAMLVTFDGQFTPQSYQPLRFTFVIWIMVVVGGSGNNKGAILGGFLIWFYWVQAEPIGYWLINVVTFFMSDENALRQHLLANSIHMRPLTMGILIILVMRFNPKGLLPEPRH